MGNAHVHGGRSLKKLEKTTHRLKRKREGVLRYLELQGVDVISLSQADDRTVIHAIYDRIGDAMRVRRASIHGLHYHYSRALELIGVGDDQLPNIRCKGANAIALGGTWTFADARKFYEGYEWRKVRYEVLKRDGARCAACGANPSEVIIHVDHIRPLRYNWELRLDPDNLQCLCAVCNHGKGNWDDTDWRK